jgi:hypothetical protein
MMIKPASERLKMRLDVRTVTITVAAGKSDCRR